MTSRRMTRSDASVGRVVPEEQPRKHTQSNYETGKTMTRKYNSIQTGHGDYQIKSIANIYYRI